MSDPRHQNRDQAATGSSPVPDLRAGDAHFRTVADSAPVLIWMSDRAKRGVFFNKTWLDYTGRSLEQEQGSGWLSSIHPDDIDAMQVCESAFVDRRPFRTQFRLRRHDGEYRWMLDSGVPLHDPDGTFVGFVGSCTDITEKICLEEALTAQAAAMAQADARKNEFLAMLGHELRNPLAPLRSSIDLFQARIETLDPELRKAVDVASRQLRHLRGIVDDLLDVARVTRGRIELDRNTLALTRPVEAAIETLRPETTAKNLQLDLHVAEPGPTVDGDEIRLTQIFVNLLRNATQYTPDGGQIRVRIDRQDGMACVAIIDTGVGIDAPLLPHVFDLFRQSERGIARAEGGLGIGLTMSRKLVELHGGRITAHSDGPGRGSTFSVLLPLAVTAAAVEAAAAQAAATAQPCRRVLVVDDNRDAADSMASLLEMGGYQPVVAYDGQSALATAEHFAADAILLDIGLPDMDGYEVARGLREQGKTALIVALTGYGQPRDDPRSAGFDHYLLKPVSFRVLKGLLDRSGEVPRSARPSSAGPSPAKLR